MEYGVNSFILFPKVENKLKSNFGEESFNSSMYLPSWSLWELNIMLVLFTV